MMTTVQTIKMGELDALHIQSEKFTAKLLLQGGQLMEFSTSQHPHNWLWASEKVEYKINQAVRGGIPICFPLFGNYADNAEAVQNTFDKGLAKHGLARTSLWALKEQYLTGDKAMITLHWQVPQDFSEQYPHIKLCANLIFEFGELGFSITLESQNLSDIDLAKPELEDTDLGDTEICFSQAFHTYFPTDDIRQTKIEGFTHTPYIDMLNDKTQSVLQQGDILFSQEVDRIYEGSPTILLKTPTYQATLTSKNSLSTIIWNPWVEKSKTLDQFLPSDYQRMLCIETANAGKDYVRLKPNASRKLDLIITQDSVE